MTCRGLALAACLLWAAPVGAQDDEGPAVRLDIVLGQYRPVVADHDGTSTVTYRLIEDDVIILEQPKAEVFDARNQRIVMGYQPVTAGRHAIAMEAAGPGGAARSLALAVTVGEPCLYAVPGADPATAVTRPIGTILHGYNALDPNSAADRQKQGERIWQLLLWGWRALAIVPDIPNKKLLLILACQGRVP